MLKNELSSLSFTYESVAHLKVMLIQYYTNEFERSFINPDVSPFSSGVYQKWGENIARNEATISEGGKILMISY